MPALTALAKHLKHSEVLAAHLLLTSASFFHASLDSTCKTFETFRSLSCVPFTFQVTVSLS